MKRYLFLADPEILALFDRFNANQNQFTLFRLIRLLFSKNLHSIGVELAASYLKTRPSPKLLRLLIESGCCSNTDLKSHLLMTGYKHSEYVKLAFNTFDQNDKQELVTKLFALFKYDQAFCSCIIELKAQLSRPQLQTFKQLSLSHVQRGDFSAFFALQNCKVWDQSDYSTFRLIVEVSVKMFSNLVLPINARLRAVLGGNTTNIDSANGFYLRKISVQLSEFMGFSAQIPGISYDVTQQLKELEQQTAILQVFCGNTQNLTNLKLQDGSLRELVFKRAIDTQNLQNIIKITSIAETELMNTHNLQIRTFLSSLQFNLKTIQQLNPVLIAVNFDQFPQICQQELLSVVIEKVQQQIESVNSQGAELLQQQLVFVFETIKSRCKDQIIQRYCGEQIALLNGLDQGV